MSIHRYDSGNNIKVLESIDLFGRDLEFVIKDLEEARKKYADKGYKHLSIDLDFRHCYYENDNPDYVIVADKK